MSEREVTETIKETVARMAANFQAGEFPSLEYRTMDSLAPDNDDDVALVLCAMESATLAGINGAGYEPLRLETHPLAGMSTTAPAGWVWLRTFAIYSTPEFDVTDPGDK